MLTGLNYPGLLISLKPPDLFECNSKVPMLVDGRILNVVLDGHKKMTPIEGTELSRFDIMADKTVYWRGVRADTIRP